MTAPQCSAPLQGHVPGSLLQQTCPKHGLASGRTISLPPLLVPPAPSSAPASGGEVVTNGLVARRSDTDNSYFLVMAETGLPVFRTEQRRVARRGTTPGPGNFETEDQAIEWARDKYPFLSDVSSKIARTTPRRRTYRCPVCDSRLILTEDSRRICTHCDGVEIDRS